MKKRIAPIIYEDSVASTNTRMKAMAVEGLEHGTVLIARRQTDGRGRRGKSFESPPEGLYLSMLLRPECEPEKCLTITACAAVAVCVAIERASGASPQIKWPNDLLLNGRKICGILSGQGFSGSGVTLVLGVGLNVNTESEAFSPELRGLASSLLAETGSRTEPELLERCLIEELDGMYELWHEDSSAFLEEYRRRCVNIGREVEVIRDTEHLCSKAVGINEDYSLRVMYEEGKSEDIRFGEVSIRNK